MRAVVVLGLVLAATSCGTERAPAATGPGGLVEQPNAPGTYGGNVTEVEAVDGRTFRLTQTSLNPRQDCTTGATATLAEQTSEAVYITSTYTVSTPVCPEQDLTATVILNADLAGRMLVVDQRAWVLEPAGTTRGPLRKCDETVGCDPQPAGCDDDSYRLALDAGDFPRNGRSWTERSCAVPWLVLDVDITASGCSATGDDPASNPCLNGPRRVTRWVFTQRGPLWDTAATLPAAGGCGTRPPPGLPRRLCEDLPPI